MPLLLSVVESPAHPAFSALYRGLGITELRVPSQRKALAEVKARPPDWVVAEFFYGYGNNYAGANVSNLDVLLATLQRYAPAARVVVLVEPAERRYVDLLAGRFPLHAVLELPVEEGRMAACLAA